MRAEVRYEIRRLNIVRSYRTPSCVTADEFSELATLAASSSNKRHKTEGT